MVRIRLKKTGAKNWISFRVVATGAPGARRHRWSSPCRGLGVSYGPFRSRDGYAATVEHSIYITLEAHGRGIGTELMLALIEHARGAGVHAIVGGLDGANEGSLRFHQRLGFTASTPLPAVGRKFGRWLDLVFVTKRSKSTG